MTPECTQPLHNPHLPCRDRSHPTVFAAILALGAFCSVLLAQFVGYMMKSHKLIPETALAGIAVAFSFGASAPSKRLPARLHAGRWHRSSLTAGKLILILISAHVGQITHGRALELLSSRRLLWAAHDQLDDLGLGLPSWAPSFRPISSPCASC